MDMQTYYKQFENCLQEERPFCSDACPFHMDVLDFQDKLKAKRYNAAYKIFRDAVAFPDIVARICSEYCAAVCPKKDSGGSIQINLLEQTCIAKAKRKNPNEYNLPSKNGKIAIIGAGLSGLSCALRLASRKYEVVIYEKNSSIGGQLHSLLPEEIFMEDINRQFKFEEYTLNLNTEITDLSQLTDQNFNAIYVATGQAGNDFGTLSCDDSKDGKYAYLAGDTAIFAGGSLLGKDVLHASAHGLEMAREIEGFIKTGIIRYPSTQKPSKVVLNPSSSCYKDAVDATEDGIFTEDEMLDEIERCYRCQCNSCRTNCDLTEFFNKWPLQMRDEIMTTTMPAGSMAHKTPAIRLINMCTQCGRCNETCPGQIELGNMIKEARRVLHKIDRMPGAYHQFWVRDMEFANSSYAAIAKAAPGKTSCNYALFPGCHLGAANPLYVKRTYSALLKANSNTGLLLRCCSVPADWAGNEELHSQEIASLRADWEAIGKPTLIMVCSSCTKHFREYLPEIPLVSLYEIIEKWEVEISRSSDETLFSLFDPCAARNDDDTQASVRKLLATSGTRFEELPDGVNHGCCGFGGNGQVPDPKYPKMIAANRSALSDNPYITYCINCRDIFFDNNKPVKHILDILFDIESPSESLPSVTARRCNRSVLKEDLLKEIWGEDMKDKPVKKYNLIISPDIQAKMNSLRLLEEDVCHIIEMGELHGRRAYDPVKESYKCYREIGSITGWVEYKPSDNAFEVLNVYTHRMKIELEVIFNGRKADIDLR